MESFQNLKYDAGCRPLVDINKYQMQSCTMLK